MPTEEQLNNKALDISKYMPKTKDYDFSNPEQLVDFCVACNTKLERYNNPFRAVIVPKVTYHVIHIKQEDFEDFQAASFEEKVQFSKDLKTFKADLAGKNKAEFPRLKKAK